MVSPAFKRTAKSVSNSVGVTIQMAMWKRIAIFNKEVEFIAVFLSSMHVIKYLLIPA